MLRELLKTILIESENANDPDRAKILSEIFVQKLPEVLENISNSSSENRYDAEGSIGTPGMNARDQLGYLPIVYLYDTLLKENDRFQTDPYYIVYILREDRKGLYLSLNHNQEYMKKILEEKNLWDSWFGGKLQESLINEVKLIREKIDETLDNFSKTMNLGSLHAKSAAMYESASVYSKYYTLDNLPSEEELINDFKTLLNIYNDITATESQRQVWKIAPGNYEKRHKLWPILVEKGYIGVGWFGCESFIKKSFSQFKSLENLKEELRKCANTPVVGNNAKMIWNFGKEMKIGDYVVANDGLKGVWGIGIIKSDYIPPRESVKLNIDEDNEYFHFREVEWIINNPIELQEDHFFAQQTITPINSTKWGKIKDAYIEKYPEYKNLFQDPNTESNEIKAIDKPFLILKELFHQYENFYDSKEGIGHNQKYDLERQKVKGYYKIIENDKQSVYNFQDPPINHLLPIKEPCVAPASVGSITAYGYKNEDLPGLTKAVHHLIGNLIKTKDENEQKELIESFKSGPYTKGFRSAMLSPVLYYLDPEFLFINQKTVDTFNFISELIGEDEKISVELVEYIDNNQKLKDLLDTLSKYLPNLTFERFDEFCHWMCYDKLGNYAKDRAKYNKWLLKYFPSKLQFGEINIHNSLKLIMENYHLAKEYQLDTESQKTFENFMQEKLPDYLQEITSNKYKTFSSLNDKWHYYPYIALMDEKVTSTFTNGIYVNYMFREDMSGVYLALRQGVSNLKEKLGSDSLETLKEKSNESRKKLNQKDLEKFNDKLDLKPEKATFTHYYEAGNIISKFYEFNDLPDEKQLESDLKEILEIYNRLSENEFLKFIKDTYQNEIHIGLNELQRGKNLIFFGPPGSGKTVLSKIISEEYLGRNAYSLYTVHSGTDYYDLVCRIVPEVKDGNLIYSKEKRFLLDALLSEKVLILDEINRTQIDTALGIFFTYLEREHRLNDAEHIRQILLKEADEDLDVNNLINLLDKFRIIGTLNVYDKTFLFKLGDALKRRFTFIEITTKNDLIEELKVSKRNEFLESFGYKGDSETADIIIDVFGDLNKIKPLGIGILKDTLLFTSYYSENSADLAISSLIVPFFENDLNYSNIRIILERHDLNNSLSKLNSLNFGTSDINGI
ncbi:MAG: DUF3578 domain-containing protein [Methanobacteriaceae archaeon]|nr:DUF3578 domain-containing protein [Methanobacteriaceae archaeon]